MTYDDVFACELVLRANQAKRTQAQKVLLGATLLECGTGASWLSFIANRAIVWDKEAEEWRLL